MASHIGDRMSVLQSPSAAAWAPAELRSLIEQLPGCRLLIDGQHRIVAANDAYRSHCGAGEACGVVGRRCYEVSHGYDAPCDQRGESCPMTAARQLGRPERCVHVHHTARGSEYVEVELVPLRDAHGSISLYMERMQPLPPPDAGNRYVGSDPSFLRTLELVRRVARTDTSVLLLGETGTGKELMARAVHDLSARAEMPFVVVDCAGLTESLFESELFGHEKGAFTGATALKRGLVEAADGGTLFIDEVGDIPLAMQVKLLRLLETGVFRRVGGTEVRRADFRLVAATHRDLGGMVREGAFRPDLYFRIGAFPIAVPALRQRRSDIPALARSILGRLEHGHALDLTPQALTALHAHDFPGNVRELRNILERASLLTDSSWIDVTHLPDLVHGEARPAPPRPAVGGAPTNTRPRGPLEDAARVALQEALRSHSSNRRELAAALGISERTLYRKLRALES
jgi:transcriptional regulator with PAS, ATPase and Fis domain